MTCSRDKLSATADAEALPPDPLARGFVPGPHLGHSPHIPTTGSSSWKVYIVNFTWDDDDEEEDAG